MENAALAFLYLQVFALGGALAAFIGSSFLVLFYSIYLAFKDKIVDRIIKIRTRLGKNVLSYIKQNEE